MILKTPLYALAAATLALACAALAQTPPAQAPAAQGAAAPSAPGAVAAPAGDPAKGREGTRMCSGCHEIEGWHTAFPEVYHVPRLAGQNEGYLIAALKEYRSGDRQHPSMRQIAASLTDEDIANLAAYYARGATRTAVK